jgi:hypothetical protein
MTCATPTPPGSSLTVNIPKAIQTRLGHGSIAVIMDRYAHLMDGLDDQIALHLDTRARSGRPLNRRRADRGPSRHRALNDQESRIAVADQQCIGSRDGARLGDVVAPTPDPAFVAVATAPEQAVCELCQINPG